MWNNEKPENLRIALQNGASHGARAGKNHMGKTMWVEGVVLEYCAHETPPTAISVL